MKIISDLKYLMYLLGDENEIVEAKKNDDGTWFIAVKSDKELLDVMREMGGYDKTDFFRILMCGKNEKTGCIHAKIIRVTDENQNSEGQ